jgi:hypothetical protein
VQRKLAASIAMTHTITMDEGLTSFRLQEKGGPIDNDNLYAIGGAPVSVLVGQKGNTFEDSVKFRPTGLELLRLRTGPEVLALRTHCSRAFLLSLLTAEACLARCHAVMLTLI